MELARRKFLTNTAWATVSLLSMSAIPQSAQAFCGITTIEQFIREGKCVVTGVELRNKAALNKLYTARMFAPLWLKDNSPTFTSTVVIERLENSKVLGLDPAKYYGKLLSSIGAAGDNSKLIEYEVLLTDAMLSYFDDIAHGSTQPPSKDSGWHLKKVRLDTYEITNGFFNGEQSLRKTIEDLQPIHARFNGLLQSLQYHHSVAENGGWASISNGPTLKIGDQGKRVTQLHNRLLISRDLPGSAISDPTKFDATLADALVLFQQRHGLLADGVMGPQTLKTLNVPVEQRLEQLQLNLDRWRWLPRNLGSSNITVNTAGYDMDVTLDGAVAMNMKVIVGKRKNATPVFSDTMDYLVFKPSWYVPKSISGKLLASEAKQPGWLADNNYEVLKRKGGRSVPFSELTRFDMDPDFFSAKYMLRQLPGDNNALGQLKFMFPNKFSIYLHDTPKKSLFAKTERAYSHGCVRLEKPEELADLLLTADGRSSAEIDAFRLTDSTVKVNFNKPLPVHLTYQTAWVDDAGATHFRDDLYKHDQHSYSQLKRNHSMYASAESNALALVNTTLASNLN